jgi:hypothetical protein
MNAQPSLPCFWRDPDLPFVESRRAVSSRACYRPHTHVTYSMGVVDAGRSVFTSQGHSVRLAAGSLVAVPAGCVHACNPEPGGEWSYQMLYLDASWVDNTLQQNNAPAWPRCALVVRDARAYDAFCALNRLLFSDADANVKTAALNSFLSLGSWRTGDAVALTPPTAPASFARVQRCCSRGVPTPSPSPRWRRPPR